jgi:hypothetical protein
MLMLSPAMALTARNFSSSSAVTAIGQLSSSSLSIFCPGFSGSGTLAVSRPSAALSFTPHDQTYRNRWDGAELHGRRRD